MSADPTKLLPNELLAASIDLGDTAAILRASHVCARWRAIARGCPGFWRWLRIAAVSPTALDFFRARINSSTAPGIGVAIIIHGQTQQLSLGVDFQFGLAAATVRMELEKHLHRIASLNISAAALIMNAIAPALTNSAGSLSILALQVPSTPGVAAPYGWSKSWVSNNTPLLRTILLGNIAISITEPERWFGSATDIRISFTTISVFVLPSDLFDRFPRGERIHIGVNFGARIHVAPPMVKTAARVRPYSVITLAGDEAIRLVLPLIPRTPVTRTIVATSTVTFDLDQFLLDLTGPLKLRMSVQTSPHSLDVLFERPGSSPLSRYARIRIPVGHDPGETATAFFARLTTDIIHRVLSICVHLDSVHLLGLMAPAVQALVLELEVHTAYRPGDEVAKSFPIGGVWDTFPQLKRIIVRPGRPYVPRPHDLLLSRLMYKFFGDVEGQTGGRSRPEIIVIGFPATVASQRPM